MNVLVYAGPGTTAESVKYCIESLRLHLSPHYAVVTVGESSLLGDPWQLKTKALVVPGGADLPYCQAFQGHGNRMITDFVRKGGKYLGFCAGGYYASARVEFETGTDMEVSGPRDLKFFPGTCKGCAYKGFVYNSHQGARITKLDVNLADSPSTVFNYYNGGGVFIQALKHKSVEVLAGYTEPLEIEGDDEDRAAVVYCKVGKGAALLTGTHPEFCADNNKQSILLTLQEHEEDRKLFMKACLKKLGLKVSEISEVPNITPIHFASHLNPGKTLEIIDGLKKNLDFIGNSFEDTNDTFHIHEPGVVTESDGTHILVHHTTLPEPKETPYFNMKKYYANLEQLYRANNTDGIFGKVIGYGEVVTSTNTLLDKNTRWLPHLPHGLVFSATTQISGRGRGGNVWINPRGVMAQSVLFKLDPKKAQSIVTLQYVLGLALSELILNYGSLEAGKGVGYEDMPIKLKWPNDIYALKPEYFNLLQNNENPSTVDGTEEKYAKISGALVNSQYLDGKFNLVWGAGINVSNDAPTTSLNLILGKLNEIRVSQGLTPLPPYEHEVLLAKVMFTVNQFYGVFEHSGMTPFLPLYYKRWFHSDQLVTVTSDGKNRNCRIEGITKDNGLLIVKDTNTGETLELQPDGNSFDIFKGLVYRKIK